MSNFITSPSYAGDIANSRVDDVESATRDILKDLDGYVIDLTFTENKNAQQQINQSILKELDGYVVDLTFTQNKNAQQQVNQSVLQALDGYRLMPDGAIAAGSLSLSFAADTDTGFYRAASGEIRFMSDGNYCLFFGGAGTGYIHFGSEFHLLRETISTLSLLTNDTVGKSMCLRIYNSNTAGLVPAAYERLAIKANGEADYTIKGEATGSNKKARGVSIYSLTSAGDFVVGLGEDNKDYTMQFHGKESDGYFTYMQTESRLEWNKDFAITNDGYFTVDGDGYFASALATGGRIINYQTTVSGSYTVQHADHVLLCDTSGAPCNISIPVSEMVAGRNLIIKDKSGNAGSNNIVISTTGAEQIDGADTKTVSTNWVSTSLISDGDNWFVI